MYKSQISVKPPQSDSYRFRSTDKQNFVSLRMPTPTKMKAGIYYDKLKVMQERFRAEIDRNDQKLLQLKGRCSLYKTISTKQAIKLETCETALAKEEYMTEVINYKTEINKIQELLTAITEEHESNKAANSASIEAESSIVSLNYYRLAEIQKQIAENQALLQEKRRALGERRVEIEKNNAAIMEKTKKEIQYHQIMKKINSRQCAE